MNVSLVAALIVAILSVVLSLQNSAETTLRFFLWEFHGPLALFLMGTLVAGCAVGMLVMVPGQLRRNRALKRAAAERLTAGQLHPKLGTHQQDAIQTSTFRQGDS